jgi:hypothetical protein
MAMPQKGGSFTAGTPERFRNVDDPRQAIHRGRMEAHQQSSKNSHQRSPTFHHRCLLSQRSHWFIVGIFVGSVPSHGKLYPGLTVVPALSLFLQPSPFLCREDMFETVVREIPER